MLNIAAMAVITVLIYVEKVFPRGDLVGRIAGGAVGVKTRSAEIEARR